MSNKVRKWSGVNVPRELRMPLLRAVDKIAHSLGRQEDAQRAPTVEAWAEIVRFVETIANGVKLTNYQPSLWLSSKEEAATPVEEIERQYAEEKFSDGL